MACHPTVLGIHNMKISSDLLGNIGKMLDEKYNTTFITMQGACGDMGNRQYRQGKRRGGASAGVRGDHGADRLLAGTEGHGLKPVAVGRPSTWCGTVRYRRAFGAA